MNIAIIPARGGSKRIPRKNIKLFCGKPMLAWSIEAAQKSMLFEHIIVSTDDIEIAEIANKWGAETPFLRPLELADDMTPTVPVVAHAVEACMRLSWEADFFCCIYPCAPFITGNDLQESFRLIKGSGVDFVYPVTEYAHPVQRAMYRSDNGIMKFVNPEHELTRTQDLPTRYHDAGQFYWGKSMAWREQKKMHSGGAGMVVPNWRVVDIDTADDWKRAELLREALRNFALLEAKK
jgi:pseudaminic acid cytidylyltransferase